MSRVGIRRGPVATEVWICEPMGSRVQAMKDRESNTVREAWGCGRRVFWSLSSAVGCAAFVSVSVFFFAIMFVPQQGLSENLPMFRGNTAHTGVYEATGVPKFSQVKWTFHGKGQLISSPAVAAESIY